jgi:hypothetical protein
MGSGLELSPEAQQAFGATASAEIPPSGPPPGSAPDQPVTGLGLTGDVQKAFSTPSKPQEPEPQLQEEKPQEGTQEEPELSPEEKDLTNIPDLKTPEEPKEEPQPVPSPAETLKKGDKFEDLKDVGPAVPTKGMQGGWGAFGAGVPLGLMGGVETSANIGQYLATHMGPGGKALAYSVNPLTGIAIDNWQKVIDAMNRAGGVPDRQPYADITGHYRRSPQEFLGGRTPDEAMEGYPIQSAAGELVGGTPYMLAMPGAAAEAGYGAHMLAGGLTASGMNTVDEAARQIKENDHLDLQQLEQVAAESFVPGMLWGAGAKYVHTRLKGKEPVKGAAAEPAPEPQQPETPPPARKPPRLRVKGRVMQKGTGEPPPRQDTEDSWRNFWDKHAREPTEQERLASGEIWQAKVRMDESAAKLEGALNKMDPEMETRFWTKDISPEDWQKLDEYIETHGGWRSRMGKPYFETRLSQGHQFEPHYEFKTDNPEQELKGLVHDFIDAHNDYDYLRTHEPPATPLNETIRGSGTDSEGRTRYLTSGWRQRAIPGGIEFDTKAGDRGYKAMQQQLRRTDYQQPFWRTFDKFVKENVPHAKDEIKRALGNMPKSTQAKVLLATGLTAAYFLQGGDEKAEAAEPSPTLIGRVLEKIGSARPISRIAASEVTSDILARGFRNPLSGRVDTDAIKFNATRNKYLANMRRVLSGARHATDEERQQLSGKSTMPSQPFAGWSKDEWRKLAEERGLNQGYQQALRAEIARVDNLARQQQEKAGKPVTGLAASGPETATGMGRYNRMLHHDLADMTEQRGEPSAQWLESLTGAGTQSMFYGNYRAATMHFWEMWVAYCAKHPVSFARAAAGIAQNPVYREFLKANATKGMFERVLDQQEKLPIQKWTAPINQKIDGMIKALPHGEAIYTTMNAMGFERFKQGMGAVVSAVENSKKYPGGAEQFMSDWLKYSKTGEPPLAGRSMEFAKVEVQNFIDDNKAIMYMPEGPLKERTVFQRIGAAKPFYPFLRAVTQQTRLFASLADDAIEGATKGDWNQVAQAVRATIMGHVMVASIAGSHVIPDYVWSIMEGIAPEDTKALKSAIDDGQKWVASAGGNVPYAGQVQDFGIKYLPYLMKRPDVFVFEKAGQTAKGMSPAVKVALGKPLTQAERKQFTNAVVNTIAMGIIGRIGPQGTLNLGYLANRLAMAEQGKEDYRSYEEPWRQMLGGRVLPKKLAEKKDIPYDYGKAMAQWFFKLETPDEMAVRTAGEEKAQAQTKKDLRKVVGD